MWHDIVLLHGVIIIWICIHDCRCTSMWCILWWHKKPKHVCQRIYEWCTHTCICMYICDWDTWIHICLYIPIHTYNNMYHTIWLSMTEHMTYDMTTCYMSWLSIWGMKYMKYIMVLWYYDIVSVAHILHYVCHWPTCDCRIVCHDPTLCHHTIA